MAGKRISARENMLRTIFFQKPDYIPVSYAINTSYYFENDPEDVLDFQVRHPLLFPGFVRPERGTYLPWLKEHLPLVARKDEPFTDDFGCLWETSIDGMTGTVTKHPLADLDRFEQYHFPDPEICMGIGPVNWEQVRAKVEAAKKAGQFTTGGLRHGHTFLQLSDIFGYQNLMYAMADEEPILDEVIQGVEAFNTAIIKKYIEFGVDMITIPEDLGMQQGPMITPADFCRYIKPSYQRMMKLARDAGKIVHMHSDGDIRSLVDDIIEGGCQVINLQDLVNGIDWIAEHFRGKTCVELDVDRQSVTYSGTPKDIDDLIREEVEKIGTPEGGLMLVYGLYPGTPLENAEAVACALEKYARLGN